MYNFDTRLVEALKAEIDKEVACRVDDLVVNRTAGARDVEYQRGYIAALKEIKVNLDRISKKLNEA